MSPVNGKIVFLRNYTVWTANVDGSGELQLRDEPFDYAPEWSPDGGKIAFSEQRGDTLPQIFVMNADGSLMTRLTEDVYGAGDPAWSPDGKRIAFWSATSESQRMMGACCYEIHVIDVDGSNRQLVSEAVDADDVSWSSDGSRIAFTSRRDGGDSEIYTMAANGSDQRRLTTNPGADGNADWSPDGSKIAFVSERGRHRVSAIYVMNSDGSDPRPLIPDSQCDPFSEPTCPSRRLGPSWSPDGTQIAFWRDTQGINGGANIWVIDADGTNERNVTQEDGVSEWNQNMDPDWQALPAASNASTESTGVAEEVETDIRWGLIAALVATGGAAMLPIAYLAWRRVKRRS